MDKFLINGPCKIKGKVSISGSKNASLPILAATLLFDKPVTIKNLPRVRDIDTMLNLLKSLGSKIILSKDKKTAKIINKKNMKTLASYSLVKTMRGSILEPRDFNKLSIVSISLTLGRFLIITTLSKRIVDARIGKAAFLLPDILTCPFNLQGPLIKNLSIYFILAT